MLDREHIQVRNKATRTRRDWGMRANVIDGPTSGVRRMMMHKRFCAVCDQLIPFQSDYHWSVSVTDRTVVSVRTHLACRS